MELLDLGVKPISDDKPSGTDARYEPEYDELQLEIDKLSSATSGGGIDWKHVAKLSSAILLKKSKDMKVASYMAVALIHLKGVEGVSLGAQVMLDLVNNFWDTMFPAKKRIRGRFNAVQWWADNSEKFLKEYAGEELEPDIVETLSGRIDAFDAALADKSEDAPILRSLGDYVSRLPVKVPEPPVEVPQQESSPTDGMDVPEVVERPPHQPAPSISTPAPVSPASSGGMSSDDDYRRQLGAGLSTLSSLADYLLNNNLADPSGYRFRRMAAWLPVPAAPPGDKGKTMIPPPDSMVRDSIINQINSGDFAGAVQAAESRIGEYLFWLDLSRLTSEALDGLGGPHLDAKDQVDTETGLFVKRLSGIESMSFSDGTPFADAKTKKWLKSINSKGGGEEDVAAASDSIAGKVISQAEELAKNKKIFDAVTVIQDSLNRVPSFRDRFVLRIGMVRLLTDVDQSALARVHAQELLEYIDKYGLEEWEPMLALSGFKAVYEALDAEEGEEVAGLSESVLQRIGRMNPAEALKINGL